MRLFLFFFLLIILTKASLGQTVEEVYPKTIWCPNDTFLLRHKGFPKAHAFKVSREDNGSPGSDAKPNDYVMIYYGKDSLQLNYHNKIPYAHINRR